MVYFQQQSFDTLFDTVPFLSKKSKAFHFFFERGSGLGEWKGVAGKFICISCFILCTGLKALSITGGVMHLNYKLERNICGFVFKL